MYLALKHLHITAVVLSFGLFALRGLWMLVDSPQRQRRWVRIVPHAIDTVLLASALGLVAILHQYPFVQGWLDVYKRQTSGWLIINGVGRRKCSSRATSF